ncbi:MAG: hypothetical protein ACRD26_19910, partial [Vicinamibacterales bacterium]
PQVGYEYASNAAIAEALSHIPAGHAVVATNDTRYRPSSTVDRQFQIPSIFGHRAYFVDGVNDRFDVTGARMEAQQVLRQQRWDADIPSVAAAEGWTHFLVRRDSPHPREIPLPLIFDNGTYAVYAFDEELISGSSGSSG